VVQEINNNIMSGHVVVNNGVVHHEDVVTNGVVHHEDHHHHAHAIHHVGDELNLSLEINLDGEDVPRPTLKGGYSHTAASRAKIGAANKGKTPWNKGRGRSPEVKARIAAGVRAKNRERFLQSLADQGLTEQDYDKQQEDARQLQESRRTEKGGYRPTDETRTKISNVLKQKYANGEIKRKPRDPSKIRRGFTHSEETRSKISESLRNRWATDPEYREKMTVAATNANNNDVVRKKISTSLKAKWQDPAFRAEMLSKISTRKSPTNGYDDAHREAISLAMKKKWQDQEYRKKAMDGIQKKHEADAKLRPAKVKKAPPSRAKKKPLKGSSSASEQVGVRLVQPLSAEDVGKQRETKKVKKKKKRKSIRILDSGEERPKALVAAKPLPKGTASPKRKAAPKEKKKKEPDGSVNRLRDERRDLFDLLYGDEDNEDDDDDDDDDEDDEDDENTAGTGFIDLDLGDEDLDTYDPYGLED
jgi:hypothetical protein